MLHVKYITNNFVFCVQHYAICRYKIMISECFNGHTKRDSIAQERGGGKSASQGGRFKINSAKPLWVSESASTKNRSPRVSFVESSTHTVGTTDK